MRAWPLTARGTGAVLLAVGFLIAAAELGVTELVYVAVLLLAAVGAALLTLFVVRRSEGVTRTLDPDVVTVGHEAAVRVRVGMRAALPSAPGAWRDTLSPGLSGTASGVFPALDSGLRQSGHEIDLSYALTGTQRGVRALGPLSVSSTDPFGLVRRTHVLGHTTRVVVAPEIIDLPALRDLPGEAGGMLHSATNQLGQGSDNLVPRAYMSGDSMRRIHWRASAHRDELMVRQEEQESTPAASVVIDLSARRFTTESMRAPGVDPGFESAVTACISAVARLVREGYTVAIVDADGTPLGDPIEGGDLAEVELLAAHLASLVARRDDRLSAAAALFTGSSAGPVVLIVGRLDEDDAAAIAPIPHHSSLPVLLVVAPHGDALARAAEAGWHAGAIGPDDDLVGVWTDVIDRGARHVVS